MNTETIQSLWVGNRLSLMEQLSLRSFLAQGHTYHLYVYGDIVDVPHGILLKDANTILPASRVFKNKGLDTYAAFSDFFRYRLLLMNGGWWVDTDMICMKPFAFPSDYVFSSEHEYVPDQPIREMINSGAIKAPKGSLALNYAWETCLSKDPETAGWDDFGPTVTAETVNKFSLHNYVQPAVTFCPIPHWDVMTMVAPGGNIDVSEDTYAIHLWHELWRQAGISGDAQFPATSLYEKLKKLYL